MVSASGYPIVSDNNMILQNSNSNSNAVGRVTDNASYISEVAMDSIDNIIKQTVAQLPYFAAGIIVIGVFWLIGKIVRGLFFSISKRTSLDTRLRVLFSRLIGLSVFVLGIFAAMTIIIPNFTFGNLIAGLGFTSFIVGFATKDILTNLLSGVMILWQQPFKIGDNVIVKGNQGDVEEIGVRATRLKMDDGERILIPNGDMYSNALIIRSAGANRRMKLRISVSYKSSVARVKEIIHEVLLRAEGVENDPKPNVYVTDLASDGVNLAIYFWINTEKNSPIGVFDSIATNIKESLNESGVVLYPPTVAVLKDEGLIAEDL